MESSPDAERSRRRVPRWVPALVAGLLVFDLVAAGMVVDRVGATLARRSSRNGAHAGERVERAGQPTKTSRELSIGQLLSRRSAAVLSGNRSAFLATVDPHSTAFRAAQARVFANLREVPLASWEYRLDDADAFTLPRTRRAALGQSAIGALVRLRYGLKGYDNSPVGVNQYLTFVQRGTAWYVASDSDGAAAGKQTSRELWDFGKVTVTSGDASVVLGLGSRSTLRRYVRDADRAVPAVTRVWGSGWPRKVLVVVPRTEQQMATLLGAKASDYEQIAAVTTGELGVASNHAAADRVIINPEAFRQLAPLGRRVVMAHEVTHVATRAATKSWTPTWLAEGFADYTGYLNSGVPVRAAASELVKDVRDGQDPTAMPSNEDFSTTREDLAQAYEMSWLACRFIAMTYGRSALVDFYRAVGDGHGDAAVDEAFARVLHTSRAGFTNRWRSYVESVAE